MLDCSSPRHRRGTIYYFDDGLRGIDLDLHDDEQELLHDFYECMYEY